MFPESARLYKEIISQSLWGRRGIIKTSSLWLPLSVALSANVSDDRPSLTPSLLIFLSVAFWCQACILANDLTDYEHDRSSSKQRWILRIPLGAAASSVALLAVLGVLILLLMGVGPGAIGAYGGALVVGLLYSIRPVRFKERGLMGPLAYGLSGALAFAVVPLACLGTNWPRLVVLALAVLLDKWVNLHFHQVVDYDADCRSGIRTYAVEVGKDHARRLLKWVAGLTSAWLLGTLTFIVVSQTAWRLPVAVAGLGSALALAVYIRVRGTRPHKASALLRELPWHYLVLTYVAFRILPLVLLFRLSLLQPTMLALFALAALVLVLESWYSVRYQYN